MKKEEDYDDVEMGVAIGGEGALAIVWACYGLNTAVTMICWAIGCLLSYAIIRAVASR